ncbi:hypothetical protein GE061_017439, partial [Apolygus lucorum]
CCEALHHFTILMYQVSELYSEDSSDAISTPSCTSLEDVTDRRLNWNKEIPALHNLEEGMMQARQIEDMKQAKMQRKARGPSTWSGVETSDQSFARYAGEGRQIDVEDDGSFQATQQLSPTEERKSKGQSSTGSEASSGGSSFVSIGGNNDKKSRRKSGIQLK